MTVKFTIDEITNYLEKIFPQVKGRYRILKLGKNSSEVQLLANKGHLSHIHISEPTRQAERS